MKDGLREEGYIKGVISLLIICLLVFIGMSFAMPHYRYYAFKTESEGYLKIETQNPEIVRGKIMESAREINVPVLEENLTVTRHERGFSLKVFWSEEVDLFGYYKKKLDFAIDIEN